MSKPTGSQTSGEIRFLTLNPRRKLRNRLQKPKLQFAFAMYSILLTILFALATIVTVYVAFGDLYRIILNASEYNLFYENAIRANLQASIVPLIAFLVLYVMSIVVVSVLFTHRMVGPTTAFLRHINALKDGTYSARIKLRKYDELTEISDELNELAEILECKSWPDRKEGRKAS